MTPTVEYMNHLKDSVTLLNVVFTNTCLTYSFALLAVSCIYINLSLGAYLLQPSPSPTGFGEVTLQAGRQHNTV